MDFLEGLGSSSPSRGRLTEVIWAWWWLVVGTSIGIVGTSGLLVFDEADHIHHTTAESVYLLIPLSDSLNFPQCLEPATTMRARN